MQLNQKALTATQLLPLVRKVITSRNTPYIAGSPGIGKSDLMRQLAVEANLKVIDLRLSQCAPEDLQGYPMLVNDKARFVPFDAFPVLGDELPKKPDGSSYNGWLLFLDELSSARKEVQAAAYKLILDRMVGSLHLHEKVYTVAAGNLESDNAIVVPMSTALQSRLVHFEMKADANAWLNWAYGAKIDQRIVGFINFSKSKIMTFDPDHTDKTYACPRTWHMLSDMVSGEDCTTSTGSAIQPLVHGTIGEGVGIEFMTYCNVSKDLPTYASIIADGNKILADQPVNPIPSRPEVRFAIISMLIADTQITDIKPFLAYLKKFSKEFQIIAARGIAKRNPSWRNNSDFAGFLLDTLNAIS